MAKVWLTQVGRSSAYRSYEHFAQEARRLGFSRKVYSNQEFTNKMRPSDVVLFGELPQGVKLKRGERVAYRLIIRGFGIITSFSIHPKNPEAKEALTETIREVNAKKVGEGGGRIERLCGFYVIGDQWQVEDWDMFFETLEAKAKERGLALWDGFTILVNGRYYDLPAFETPFELPAYRVWRLLTDEQVQAIAEHLAIEHFINPDEPNLNVLVKYVQCVNRNKDGSMTIKMPDGGRVRVAEDELDIIL